MPQYDYGCAGCGPFTLARPMAEFDRAQPCPGCGADSPRVMLTVPGIAGMDAGRRAAFATNERSANAPARAHPSGCGCCKPARLRADAPRAPSRPWMLGH